MGYSFRPSKKNSIARAIDPTSIPLRWQKIKKEKKKKRETASNLDLNSKENTTTRSDSRTLRKHRYRKERGSPLLPNRHRRHWDVGMPGCRHVVLTERGGRGNDFRVRVWAVELLYRSGSIRTIYQIVWLQLLPRQAERHSQAAHTK